MKNILKLLVVVCLVFMPCVEAKTIDHSYVKADNDIEFKDTVFGSSVIAGESINSNGRVDGVNIIAGNKVDYKGQSEYFSALGNNIEIDGSVLSDSFIAGNIINIRKNSYLQRDVMIAGSDIMIEGNIGRNVTIYGGKVVIGETVIGGNVKIFAENIKIKDSAVISGTVSYPKDAKAKISSNIINIKKTSPIKTDESDVFMKFLINKIWSFMGLVVVFAFMTLLVPVLFSKMDKSYKKLDFNKIMEVLSKGLVFLIIVPVFVIVSLLIPFGVSLSLITIALYIISLYISKIFAAYLIGYKLWQKCLKKDINILLVGLLGLLLLFVLDFIPIVRSFVSLFSILLGVGIIVELFMNRKKA